MVAGTAVPLVIRRSRQARNYRLSYDPTQGTARLSIPWRASVRDALRWAGGHEGWLRSRIEQAPAPIRLVDGGVFPLEGQDTRILWDPMVGRRIAVEDGVLRVGGAAESLGPRVIRWLKARAKTVLEAETRALAVRHTLPLTTVSVGDPRSRWGSCSSSGAIRYSWRLILAPADVRRATVAHELAHLLHMDHSPAFHAAHARLLEADPRPARAWLKAHGAGLHRISL